MPIDPKKLAKLNNIKAAINKSVKNAELNYLGASDTTNVKRLTTGVGPLDDAMGGGLPEGRIVEYYGGESSAKTTMCLHNIAAFQKAFPDDVAAFIDSENSFESDYAKALGVNTDELLFQQPDTGEDALNVIKHLLQSGVRMIVVDSVAALTPKAEKEKAFGEKTMGEGARMMSTALKQLISDVNKANAYLIFTNQTRDKIGVMYGDKSTTPGGKALKFYASIRVEMRPIGFEKENDVPVCVKIKALCKKNKTFPPMRVAEYTVTFGIGVDKVIEQFNDAIDYGVLVKSGSWFAYDGKKLCQGKPAAMKMIRDDKELLQKIVEETQKFKAEGKKKVVKKEDLKKLKVLPTTSSEDEENTEEQLEEAEENVEVSDI